MSDHGEELHLPHGSKWPILVALGITLTGVGFVVSVPFLAFGVLVLLGTIVGWVVEDVKWWRDRIGTGDAAGKLGTILFMSSEVFLFGALFATYFSFRATATAWPDTEVHLPIVKTAIFSVFLISSSFTIHHAEALLKKGNKRGFNTWWLITILLGAVFLAGQVLEYIELIQHGVVLNSGQFASTFYMITGTHGLHVLAGLIVLIIVYIRSMLGQFDENRHLLPKTAALYWHFVDAIWIVVFTMLYIVQ